MNEIQCWRFLVSRNLFLDYRTVAAPDFMCQANITSLLAKSAEGDLTNENNAYYREIHGSKTGDLTLIYRISEAQANYINPEAEGVLKDSFGREIFFIEGIVVKGLQSLLSLTTEDIESIHHDLINDYREFWEWVSPQPSIASELKTITFDKDAGKLSFTDLEPYIIDNKQTSWMTKNIKPVSESKQSDKLIKLDGKVDFVRFLDNSRILIHHDKSLTILNLKAYEQKILIKGDFHRYIRKVSLSSDAKFICTANVISLDRNVLKIWDLNNSTEKQVRESNPSELGRVTALAFSSDASVIATFEKNNSPIPTSSMPIKLIDTKIGGIRGEELNWHISNVRCIESSQFDNIFASGDEKGCVIIWNWKNLQQIGSLDSHSSTVNAIAFSSHQKILVSGGDDGRIKIVNYENGVKDQGLLGESSGWVEGVNTLAFSPNGESVASGGDDDKIRIWDVKTKTQTQELSGHSKSVMSVSFSPNGKLLVSGSKDNTIRIWQIV